MDENTTNDDLNTEDTTADMAVDTSADTAEETTSAPAASSDATTASTNVVFVGSLAWATTDETLRAHFENAGLQIGEDEVVKNDVSGREFTRRAVTVARYPDTKKSRGYGFVTLVSAEEAQKAVETLNDTELDGRNIRVQLKDMTPREDRPRRSFGDRGGFGGDRRGGNSYGGGNRRDNYRGGYNNDSNNDSWAA